MNQTPKISVIVPVYGVEDYIEKCIRSLLNQSFTNFEVLIIDDGCLDQSITKAKKMVADDPRFIFLEKENGGQGSARNMGLDYASGEYIGFIDSDDYVSPLYLELMYKKITLDNAEICLCDINYVKTNGEIIKTFINKPHLYLSENDYLLCKYYISTFICDKLFHKSVFKNMRFDKNIRTFEDAHFTFKLIYKHKLTHINEKLYNYVQRPASTSHALKPTYIIDRVAVKNSHMNFAKEINSGISEDKSYITYCYLKSFVFFTSVTIARYSFNYSEDIKRFKSEIDLNIFTFKNILPIIKNEPKVGLSLLLYKISPKIFRYFVKFWFRNAVA